MWVLILKQVDYEVYVVVVQVVNVGMLVVMVNYGGIGEGIVVKDIWMDNFSIFMGGCEFINEVIVIFVYGRCYGENQLFLIIFLIIFNLVVNFELIICLQIISFIYKMFLKFYLCGGCRFCGQEWDRKNYFVEVYGDVCY